jgi:translation initiation factor IF-1
LNNKKFLVLTIALAALLGTSQTSSFAQGAKYSVGQRVMADATGIGNFKAGVVTEVLPFGRYRVQIDEEVGKYDPTVMLEKNMKPGAPAPQAGSPAAALAAGKPIVENYTVGQKVMGDPTGLGNMKPGVVTEVLPFDRYRVQFDDEIGHGPTVMLERNMKKGGAATQAGTNGGTASGANAGPAAGANIGTAGGGGNFSAGQRVMADATGIGNFKAGVITEVLPFDRFRVQFDDEVGKYDPTVILKKNMKAGGAPTQNPATNPVATATQPANPAHNPTHQQPAHQAPAQQPAAQQPAQQPHDEHAADSDSPQWHTQGKGAPPSGRYVCEGDAVGFNPAGDGLEIRGNTYRGIGQEGGFHPYTLGALNRINWSAGLMSLPDGTTIKHSYYHGPDYMGRPLIKIYYRSKSGWNHCVDCFMGK